MIVQKPLLVTAIILWLSTMGYLILKIIDGIAKLIRDLFPEQTCLENIQQIPSYLRQVGITISYISFGIILLSIIICGIYLGLKKSFTYWRMIEFSP